MCKHKEFSITEILCEINFGESKSPNTAFFASLQALNSVNLVNFSADLASLEPRRLISRKNKVIEKYVCKFPHCVLQGCQDLFGKRKDNSLETINF